MVCAVETLGWNSLCVSLLKSLVGTQLCSKSIAQNVARDAVDMRGGLVCGFHVLLLYLSQKTNNVILILYQSAKEDAESIKQSPVLEPKGIQKCSNLNLLH